MKPASRTCLSVLATLVLAAPAGAQQREAIGPTETKLDLTPFDFAQATLGAELVPVLAGDKVLVSSTLRLFAVSAHTGELLWSAGPPAGWEGLDARARKELVAGVDYEGQLHAPAAGGQIVVAALQVHQVRKKNEEWQTIQITRALPERRLHAFDLATGCSLWDHAPPPGWDGTSGPFPRRMSLIASPLVVEDRVLVPCTSDESSIDYHVACYHLGTGALLWTTFVTRGQAVPRNMFGNLLVEFTATPLVAAAGKGIVLAQTGLGVVAALDLATGDIRWRAEYPQIPLPNPKKYGPPKRQEYWRLAPPVVTGDVVLAAPLDSDALLAFDLADGHALWSVSANELGRLDRDTAELDFDRLIGADADALYLGGAKVSALTKPGGLASTEPLRTLWTRPIEGERMRAQLAGELLFVSGTRECLALDRRTGVQHASFPVPCGRGLLVTEEAVFVLTLDSLLRSKR